MKQEKFDTSFKNFFKIMWSNTYIQIFVVALGISIYELITIGAIIEDFKTVQGIDILMNILAYGLAPTVASIVGYKTMQFWEDLKNGRSR